MLMESAPAKIARGKVPGLAIGLFRESHSAHGAVADLESAGFGGDQIAIAFSAEGEKAHKEGSGKGHWGEETAAASEFSLAWKLRQWFEKDLHRHGVESLPDQRQEHCSEVDLEGTLKGLGVAEDRILLLDQILGVNGVLVLVDARERSREAEVILEKNCGQIRSDSATERPPVAVGLKAH
jgi:hypothetical protein